MPKVKNSSWVATASSEQGWPKDEIPEVAIVGRSNAGKSTLLNALIGRREARVSQKPGKTTLLHFYSSPGGDIRFVDMPGYGFARRGAAERDEWGPMIESYLAERENLRGLVLIMDAKRPWTKDEANLLNWLEPYSRAVLLVLNKTDKFNRKELDALRRHWESQRDPRLVGVQYISAKSRVGTEELLRTIFEKLVLS